jgi:hypothetical protein
MLFAIFAELLKTLVTNSPCYKEITLYKTYFFIDQYANDTVMYVEDRKDFLKVRDMVKIYEKASEIKLNEEKNSCMFLRLPFNCSLF